MVVLFVVLSFLSFLSFGTPSPPLAGCGSNSVDRFSEAKRSGADTCGFGRVYGIRCIHN